jgi:hypothetical protein
MIRYTRQEAKALGVATCYGSMCKKHPLLEGLRRVSGACIECAKENLRVNRAANIERTKAQQRKDQVKLLANPEAAQKKLVRDAQYRKNNRAAYRASIVAWCGKNPEKVKLYAARNKANNKGKVNANTVKRRLAKANRTPAWLTIDDYWMIEQAYELAALRTKLSGFAWHVDHVLPLQGKLVSGFHMPYNLQVIPGVDNVRKSNTFEAAVT